MDRERIKGACCVIAVVGIFLFLLTGCNRETWEKDNMDSRPNFNAGDVVAFISEPDKSIGHVYKVEAVYLCGNNSSWWAVYVRMTFTGEVERCRGTELLVKKRAKTTFNVEKKDGRR